MRKLALLIGVILGAGVGLLASLTDGIGLKIVMMSIGAIAGAAIGGAISRIGNDGALPLDETEEAYGQGTSARDRMRNFWRDKGSAVRFSERSDNSDGTR